MMKTITTLAIFIFLAIGAVQAQNNAATPSTTKTTKATTPEAEVRNLIQLMTQRYSLNGEQQIAVKKFAMTIAETAKGQKLTPAQRESLRNDFNARMQPVLNAAHQEHFKNAQKTSTNPILDAIMDAAAAK